MHDVRAMTVISAVRAMRHASYIHFKSSMRVSSSTSAVCVL